MTSELPRLVVRMEETQKKKLRIIAERSLRSLNAQATWVLMEYIKNYERKNGDIKIE
ncbi:MAG: Arc family DNA-binding protein [Negativicutes bacterium]|nr:Arc family DNA-binding protein [Negativicutes bacterium]